MQSFFIFYFSLIAFQVLRRKRQRLNIIFSSFFISIIIANILNMIYAALDNVILILILNFFTNFFLCFGPIFILIVNIIILESTVIFPVKRQNRYILLYSLLLLFGMSPFYFLGGVTVEYNAPRFNLLFLVYVISFSAAFAVFPMIYTSLKIYSSFKSKALKKKWLFYILGFLGSVSIAYLVFLNNYIFKPNFRLIVAIYSISVILWGFLMYYGIGFKLKDKTLS